MKEDEYVQKKVKKQLEQERLRHKEAIRLQEQINEEERQRIARDAEIAKQLQEEFDRARQEQEVVAEADQAYDIDWSDPVVCKDNHAHQNISFSMLKNLRLEKEVMKRPRFDFPQKSIKKNHKIKTSGFIQKQPAEEEKERKNDDSQQKICKKQTVVSTSTTEAEYVAAASCCGQVLWIQNQLLDYGYNFMNTMIHIDNNSTICIIENPVQHSKTKHIEIRHHFIRDCNAKKLIQMVKINIDHNVADLLTKGFDAGRFQYLVSMLLEGNSVFLITVEIFKALTSFIGEVEIKVTVDGHDKTITEASVRSSLKLADADGISNMSTTKNFKQLALMGQTAEIPQSQFPTQTQVADEATFTSVDVDVGGAATTEIGLDVGQGSGIIHKTPTRLNDAPLLGVNTPGSAEGSLSQTELTDLGRMIEDIDLDVDASLVQPHAAEYFYFVTPTKIRASREAHSSDISPEDQLGVLSVVKILADASRSKTVSEVHTYIRRRRDVNTGSKGVNTAGDTVNVMHQNVNIITPCVFKSLTTSINVLFIFSIVRVCW
ncbi:hypothetical protein Tco_1150334 [Tanacetum coccineum]